MYAEFARALVRLMRNVPYMYCAGVKICANMVVVGVLLNAVRYVEIAFYQPAFVASIISGQWGGIGRSTNGTTAEPWLLKLGEDGYV